jgi:hypothetical protein
VSPVKYELGFYIPEDDILHSRCRVSLNLTSVWLHISLTFKYFQKRQREMPGIKVVLLAVKKKHFFMFDTLFC